MIMDLIVQVALIAMLLVLTVAVVDRIYKNYKVMRSDYEEAMRDNDDVPKPNESDEQQSEEHENEDATEGASE